MSLYGMMRTGVSGMNAQSNRLGTVADNIANSSTMGYKRSYTEFSALVLPSAQGSYSSGAVKTTVRNAISDQGLLQFTTSTTDIAIQGDGFFMVQNEAGQQFLTRSGSFVPDAQGRLINAAGFYLLGTQNDAAQLAPDDLGIFSVSSSGLTAAPSTRGEFTPNLPALAADGTIEKASLTLYTAIGEEKRIDLVYTKTGANTWEVSAYDHADLQDDGTYSAGPLAGSTTTLDFDPATGQLQDTSADTMEFEIPKDPLTGTADFTLALAGTTELAADYTYSPPVTDGSGTSGFDEVQIGANGMVSAITKTGSIIDLFRIPLATVGSPDRLSVLPGYVYQVNAGSGALAVGAAASGNRGEIVSGALEGSNVDIAEELTNMIESQRNYTANSKVFQTGADLLDVLVNLKR